jgi:sarcosine oxidase gamma subunit
MAGRHRLASWTWSVHRVHALRSTAPHTLILTAHTASVQEDCRLQQRSLVAWLAPGQYLVRSLGGDPCAALAPEYENVHWGGPLPLPR